MEDKEVENLIRTMMQNPIAAFNFILNDCDKWYKYYQSVEIDIIDCKDAEEELKNLDVKCETIKSELEEKQNVLKTKVEEFDHLRKEWVNLEEKEKTLKQQHDISEANFRDIRKKSVTSKFDNEILNLNRKKLQTYTDLTNVHWDYLVPTNKGAAGYVRNKKEKYIHAFNFKKPNNTMSQITEKLWNVIEVGCKEELWNDLIQVGDENKQIKNENVDRKTKSRVVINFI